ncbi:hypothetical protein L226DRAFT_248451 [Lentinus tigrinus ALCF2SS1-7]|uniref:Uncharacterized protein n=1 Tax=Lentinus tigrinus ALCF2SS1-6 TaxID=1328759 RepID=A0A5C2SN72_9APHY|nr:hypothetical protein L227DRAFT_204972 [Lentinus tigrinus ALCF2SS1-6]RPD79380.1 hypothetical protein L226DRAFT_248451 [Lentinus tigrinus ALCF2SS1-7]
MALALPTATALAEVMAQSSSINDSELDCRIVVSTEPRALASHRDAFVYTPKSSPLSPVESDDDTPMSPITFGRNEDYERNRLSFIPPSPRPSTSPSSPVSPQSMSPISPVIFTQFNLSTPSLVSQPLPVFPTAGTQSLALRLKRPLPPLPKVNTDDTTTRKKGSRQELIPRYGGIRPSPSSSDGRDSDSGVNFSPAGSSQSPATSLSSPSCTSLSTMASSDSAGSSEAVEAFPADTKPRIAPLTIPTRSQSHPLPQSKMPPIGQPIISPYISVTPASPVPHQQFPFSTAPVQQRKRTASATSIVIPSPYDTAAEHPRDLGFEFIRTKDLPPEPSRAPSPAPSLTPSVSSSKGFAQAGKSTLKRIASKTRLFGRRTLSASEPTWSDSDEDETVVGHGSVSMDDRMLRPGQRSGSPSTLASHGSSERKNSIDNLSMRSASTRSGTPEPRALRRLEIAEVRLTPEGEVWEPLDLHDVIPRLRELKAPTKIKL